VEDIIPCRILVDLSLVQRRVQVDVALQLQVHVALQLQVHVALLILLN